MNQLRIYVAGPMAKGVFATNMRQAYEAASALIDKGHWPYIPHLSWFLELHATKPAEQWLDIDFAWLDKCDALIRLPGDSVGADLEVKRALAQRKAVFYSLDEVAHVPFNMRLPLPEYRPLGGA